MKTKELFTGQCWLLVAVIICAALGLLWLASPVQAGPELPPRKPPPTNGGGSGDNGGGGGGEVGATIELHIQGAAPTGYWAAVQWQDSNGDWQAVGGWQGSAENGYQSWWVHAKDFDTGPFRWGIYKGQSAPFVAASEPFMLPAEANTTLPVTVTLP